MNGIEEARASMTYEEARTSATLERISGVFLELSAISAEGEAAFFAADRLRMNAACGLLARLSAHVKALPMSAVDDSSAPDYDALARWSELLLRGADHLDRRMVWTTLSREVLRLAQQHERYRNLRRP